MKFYKYISLFVLVSSLFFSSAKTTFASVQYTDLGDLGGQFALAHGINNNGQIVGESYKNPSSPSSTHAFLWQNGTMTDLGTLGGSTSQAFGINDQGKIVGAANVPGNQRHAFIWENGTMTDLAIFGSNDATAVAINNNDQIVGQYTNSGRIRGFLWQNGIATDLGDLTQNGNGWTIPHDINDFGQIVGQSTLGNLNQEYRAFLWENGNMTNLGLLGGFQSIASSINNGGWIVGTSTTTGAGDGRAVLWRNGVIENLGTLGPNLPSNAYSINDSNEIVGWSDMNVNSSSRRGFIWKDDHMYDLEVPEGNLVFPVEINNSRQVVGYWTAENPYHAFLINPQISADIKVNDVDGPISVPYNSSISLSWNSDYTNTCSISPLGVNSLQGSQSVLMTQSQTYTMSCTGLGGTINDSVTVNVNPPLLSSLSPAKVWIGLKNSDDIGVKFDLKADAYKDNTLVSSGQINTFSPGTTGFNHANLATIPFNAFTSVDFPTGHQLKVILSVRTACTGSGHNSGNARLWYNDAQADSQFGATLWDVNNNYYLLDGFGLDTNPNAIKKTIDVQAGAKCSAFKPFGTWTITL